MAYQSSISEAEPAAAGERGRSATDLLRQLLGDVTVLFRKELALAASEVSHSVDEAKHGVQTMITGGAVLCTPAYCYCLQRSRFGLQQSWRRGLRR